MKKTICLVLALLALSTAFAGCSGKNGKDGKEAESPKDIHEIVSAVTEVLSYDGLVTEFLYKENDTDQMVKWRYGIVDINAEKHLTDYAVTLPSDYNNTLAVFIFDDQMTEADYKEVKEVVTSEYIEGLKTALQMYMPEEYEHLKWQLEHPEAIWRQYGNVLVLCEYGSEEPKAAWGALDALFSE